MFLSSRQRGKRRGVILLVVLALITLFASIGVAFVYFAEQEATKAQDQKAGETVKLPDADLLFNDILRQLVYPTTNNASALYTQSLLENMYGRTNGNTVQNVTAFNGTGWRANYDAATGLDNLYLRNMQNRFYDESIQGSLNPPYTYPDHKHPYLGGVAANWRQINYTGAAGVPGGYGTEHGPVAIARSWAREIKFRIAFTTSSGNGIQEVILNPFSNQTFTLPSGAIVRHSDYWSLTPVGGILTMQIGSLPNAAAPNTRVYTPNATVQCNPDGTLARINVDQATARALTMRPARNLNPNFPPPGDNGGDVKNLSPEVKTLVGFNGATPIFANNDSYWMDVGFPALQWSNNRKIKPLVAMFIMDNDGKVNLNTAGNVRGQDALNTPPTYHTSAHGMGPYEINPTKIGLQYATNAAYTTTPVLPVTVQTDLGALMGGRYDASTLPAYLRGRAGFTSALNGDPTTATGTYPSTSVSTFFPILRSAPAYAPYNLDGTYDGLSAAAWYKPSQPWQLAGDILPATTADPLFRRFPYFSSPVVLNNGFVAGNSIEYQRGGFNKSPLFLSPFAPTQPTNNLDSAGAGGSQRLFGLQNHAELYLTRDTGADKFNGELRKLSPSSYLTAQQRWQQTLISNDMNNVGIAPWYNNATGDFTVPTTFTFPAPATQLTYGGTGPAQAMPNASSNIGEFSTTAGYSWRSLFGGASRLDLSRQLPDYPLPANNNTQLNFGNPVVQAQYMIALQARQRMAREIYNSLNALLHPNGDAAHRYIGQLAVNIVDYIDNDDIPTWFEVPNVAATGASRIVWGTELPRLLINEVYVEAVNHVGDPLMPMNQAQNNYDVQHWVELYNPLTSSSYPGAWATSAGTAPNNLDSEARLNVGGTSAYRLLIPRNSTSANTATMRAAANTLGYPNNLTDTQTKVVRFPANATVLPSDNNYGNGQTTTNNGFYLVGPGTAGSPTPPDGATTGAPTPPTDPLNFPTPQLSDPNMVQSERIAKTSGRFTDNNDNRSAILLQRLANPYLPHNPLNDPSVQAPGDFHDATLPYNPYITIDYVSNLKIQHAVHRTSSGSTADNDPVDQRKSVGKLQPYASMNDNDNTPTTANVYGVWVEQNPDRHNGTAGVQPLTNQPQHTFLRHNGVETDRPNATPVPVPTPNASGLTNTNTLKLPFDWLVHLDRNPTSPVDLLHVSGFKPHELTQQFNRLALIGNTTSSAGATVTPGTAVTITATKPLYPPNFENSAFIGSDNGIPYSLKVDDLVQLTWVTASGNTSEWVRVTAVNHNATTTSSTFQTTSNANLSGITSVQVRLILPFAHYAPWYRALQNVDVNSSSRLYRFLETVAVRNPGVDVGQFRFTSAVPTTTAGTNSANISAPLNPTPGVDNHSRWIQLDHGATAIGGAGLPNLTATRTISTNDALLNIIGADSVYGATGTLNGYNGLTAFSRPNNLSDNTYAVGDTVVINAGVTTGNVVEQRATVLAVDRANNRIRVVLSVPAGFATTSMSEPLTVDYTYVGGRQPGKININTMWDPETLRALADAQIMNSFYSSNANHDLIVDNIFTRIVQQRQPQYYYTPRMVGQSGSNGTIPEDRAFQGMGTGDISASLSTPQQGIGNTFLTDRYQESATGFTPAGNPRSNDMNSPVAGDSSNLYRFTRTLFEIGAPGIDHPQRRFELLSKIWNNMTVRSNTFSVWMTIGFFEYDDSTGLGAELGQIQGKNTRYRFFAVVDRSQIDSLLQSWALHDATAGINTFMDTNRFPNLDPRYLTFPNMTAISQSYSALGGSPQPALPGSSMQMPRTVVATLSSTNPFITYDTLVPGGGGRLVYVESDAGSETAQILAQTNTTITMQLTLNHSGLMTIRPLPVPPTVLYWTQMK